MSSKTVYIRSESCGQDECIVTYVDGVKNGEVKVKDYNLIKFRNELGKDYPVSVYFYKEADAKTPANAITDFCRNKSSKPFEVIKNKNCRMYKYTGEFNYSLETTSVYKPLDPVIIVEETNIGFGSPGGLAIIAVIGLVLGFLFYRWRKSGT